MPDSIRRIGVLTGGGDCPGLNAVIRAVTKTAIFQHGLEVFGIEDGFLGLVENRIHPLDAKSVSNILTVGGTILGSSNKCNPSRYPVGEDDQGQLVFEDLTNLCLRHIKRRGIDALVVIGGDGTMSGAANFVRHGVNCIGVPKTIDNDLVGTDVTFGFATARFIATEALDRLHTTAASHHRAMVVEVMGRNAGWIALESGVASGSDVILLPEIPFDLDAVCRIVTDRSHYGKAFTMIVISEGAKSRGGQQVVHHVDPTSPDPIRLGGVGEVVSRQIEEKTGIESRCTVLGHVQRGGTPTAFDRVLATRYGYHAAELAAAGDFGKIVCLKGNDITEVPIAKVANKCRTVPVDSPLVKVARATGTYFGNETKVYTKRRKRKHTSAEAG